MTFSCEGIYRVLFVLLWQDRMQDYQQSGFIEYEKDSIRFYGYAPSLLLHKRQRSV